MARKVPGKELGIDAPYVRVSTGKRKGNILAVQHPVLGWVPYRQWGMLQVVEKNLPLIIEKGYDLSMSLLKSPFIWLPIAGSITANALKASLDPERNAETEFAIDMAIVGLPFGVIYLMWKYGKLAAEGGGEAGSAVIEFFERVGGPLTTWWKEGRDLGDVIEVIGSFFTELFGKGGPIFGRPGA